MNEQVNFPDALAYSIVARANYKSYGKPTNTTNVEKKEEVRLSEGGEARRRVNRPRIGTQDQIHYPIGKFDHKKKVATRCHPVTLNGGVSQPKTFVPLFLGYR